VRAPSRERTSVPDAADWVSIGAGTTDSAGAPAHARGHPRLQQTVERQVQQVGPERLSTISLVTFE
jgi:hypothetical protein